MGGLPGYRPVSIHAPTWGATPRTISRWLQWVSFNPRSHMGSDFTLFDFYAAKLRFNPRSHMGSDNCASAAAVLVYMFQSTLPHGERPNGYLHTGIHSRVSIHAPTWGATMTITTDMPTDKFQSTLPHGERLSCINLESALFGFNPRSHMGSDSICLKGSNPAASFNPRSHMGSDRTLFINLFYNELQHYLCEINKYNN